MLCFEGYVFDIYHVGKKIHLWIKSKSGENRIFYDDYCPSIYIHAPQDIQKKMVKRLYELDALAQIPKYTLKKLFYSNKTIPVLELIISKPELLPKITDTLYKLYNKYDIYHSDIEIPTGYMIQKNIFPMGKVKLYFEEAPFPKIVKIEPIDAIFDLEYDLPQMKLLNLYLEKSQRIPIPQNFLLVETHKGITRLSGADPIYLLHSLQKILKEEDPDIVLTSYGDQVILPHLFSLSQKYKFPLSLDRDQTTVIRRTIKTTGTSFNTYGTIVFRAASYPLFGRWHIDSRNSFVFKEAELLGIIELARISRLPIQKMARASTGKSLTYIEVDVALRMNYLVPWQKSAVEEPKTALSLLHTDRGGLVFQPDVQTGFTKENVAQLDFSQMYPSIMVIHNISPETINCLCCREEVDVPKVPVLGYRICKKRRGIVSEALAHILERRAHYKKRKKETLGLESISYNSKQSSLKWMLVTSFGYLGYRNAKFGKLESHESVTAFGREKLLLAKEISEQFGYVLVHAITDSIFIQKENGEPILESELKSLCFSIREKTQIQMEVEGIYRWLYFPPSSVDPQMPVANRYMGKFYDGSFKSRGIFSRRKDIPSFIRNAQLVWIEWMCKYDTISDLRKNQNQILELFELEEIKLKTGKVYWKELLLQRSTSQEQEDYEVDGATSLSLHELSGMGIRVQAGEKIRFLVVDRKANQKEKRYKTEESIQKLNPEQQKNQTFDKTYYRGLLRSAFMEIWFGFSTGILWKQFGSDEQELPFRN